MLVIKAGYLIDGVNDGVLENQAVVIEGNKITHICPLDEIEIPADAEVADHLHGYLMPGLIDCHVHLCSPGAADPRPFKDEPEAALAFRAVANADKTLKAGFTTVRNLGSKFDVDIKLKKAIEQDIIWAPRLVASGRCVAITGGHGHGGGIEADGKWEVIKAVRTLVKAGADVIKLMATGGVMTEGVEPGAAELTKEELIFAVAEAHRAGRKTATHAQGNTGIRNAVEAGIDSVEHGVFLDEDIIEMMVEKGTALVPTLSAPHKINAHGIEGGIPKYAVEKSAMLLEQHQESFRAAYKAGVLIGLGTDAGTPFNYHGSNAGELELMVKAGMSPMDAIRAGTHNAAIVLGLDHKIGRLAPGYLADILLVKGDPLKNVGILADTKNIVQVYLGGKPAKV
ncbi:MAG: amidohydrolase family protein [Firmicutes bacterium]|nr:amidohydrolase family protein [Bacillota bacterium]